MRRIRTRHLLASAALTLTTLNACSLINPHVSWERSYEDVTASDPGDPATEQEGAVSLSEAVQYAEDGIEAYRTAMGDQQKLKSLLGLGLIPLTAAALGVGATGGGTETVLWLGLGGAAAYGAGTWLTSTPRELVYAAGAKALVCAKTAVGGYDSSIFHAQRYASEYLGFAIGSSTTSLIPATQIANEKLAAAESLIPQLAAAASDPANQAIVSDLNLKKAGLESVIASGRLAISAAETISQTGVALWISYEQAPRMLINAVDRISVGVNEKLVNTSADLASLPKILTGLFSLGSQFTALPETQGAGAPPPPGGGGGASDYSVSQVEPSPTTAAVALLESVSIAESELGAAVTVMNIAAVRVKGVVAAVYTYSSPATLKDCGVDEVALGIKTKPTSLDFKANQEGSGAFVIMGGKPPYTATLIGEATAFFIVNAAAVGGFSATTSVTGFEVKTKPGGATKPGTYQVNIIDASGNTATVSLVVK